MQKKSEELLAKGPTYQPIVFPRLESRNDSLIRNDSFIILLPDSQSEARQVDDKC